MRCTATTAVSRGCLSYQQLPASPLRVAALLLCFAASPTGTACRLGDLFEWGGRIQEQQGSKGQGDDRTAHNSNKGRRQHAVGRATQKLPQWPQASCLSTATAAPRPRQAGQMTVRGRSAWLGNSSSATTLCTQCAGRRCPCSPQAHTRQENPFMREGVNLCVRRVTAPPRGASTAKG